MPSTLLYEDTFEGEVGTVNLEDHTPTPSGGGAAEYVGAANRYRVQPAGYADANGISVSVARNPYTVPAGISHRIGGDIQRESVDFVGGEIDFYSYMTDVPIASWDFKDCVRLAIQRHSFTEVSATVAWIKAAGAPAPAAVQLAGVGSIAFPGSAIGRFEAELDEITGLVRIVASDFATGLNEVVLATGTLPAELIAHLAADRLIGWASSRAASGLVAFRLYRLAVYQVTAAAPVTGPPCTELLRVYADNRVTVLWEVSTDPNHAFPFLMPPMDLGEQELDFAAGAASLGSVRVGVVDKAQIAGDQDSGFVSGKLASLGIPDIGGHRCEYIRFDPNGNPVIIMDGPAGQPSMDDFSAFVWEIRDTRETERKIRCFDEIGPAAPVVDDAASGGPTETGTDPGFTWGTEYH